MPGPARGSRAAPTGGVQSENRPVSHRTLAKTSEARQRDDLAEHHPPDSRGQGGSIFAGWKGHRKRAFGRNQAYMWGFDIIRL